MSKKLFSNKDIELLSKNKYVKKVSEKGITYTVNVNILLYIIIFHFLYKNILTFTLLFLSHNLI